MLHDQISLDSDFYLKLFNLVQSNPIRSIWIQSNENDLLKKKKKSEYDPLTESVSLDHDRKIAVKYPHLLINSFISLAMIQGFQLQSNRHSKEKKS